MERHRYFDLLQKSPKWLYCKFKRGQIFLTEYMFRRCLPLFVKIFPHFLQIILHQNSHKIPPQNPLLFKIDSLMNLQQSRVVLFGGIMRNFRYSYL